MARTKSYDRYKFADKVLGERGYWLSPNPPFVDTAERRDDRHHTVKQGERLDTLAHRYLGDPALWWVIAEYNNIFWMLDVRVGRELRIPSYEHTHMRLLK